jgi:Spy/CpxP family protein refolding chaperone
MEVKMTKFQWIAAVVFALGAAGMTATATAQPYGGYGPAALAGEDLCCYCDEQNADTRHTMMMRRMALLHDKLRLDEKQEQAWADYERVFSASLEAMRALSRERTDLSSMETPRRLERAQKRMRERDEHITKQLHAMTVFYATLTPEQQKIFDAEVYPAPAGRYQRGRWHRNRVQ